MDGVRHSRREATWFRAIAWLGMASGFVSPAISQVGQPHVETFTVQAATEWTETGIFLLPGDQLLVRTPGAPGWTNATNGELKNAAGWGGRFAGTKVADAPLAALIQRIGADDTGEMVSRTPITVSRRGRLAFGMNDLPGTYADNQGSLTVSVQYLQQPVPMPRVVDLDQETAARQFAPFGIVPTVEYRESPTVKGVVLDVVPDRNSEMHSVESVRLIVSSGPPLAPPEVLVPNITGRPGAEAERMLIEAGLAPSNMGLEESGIQQDGTVTRSRPMGGEKVAPGSQWNTGLRAPTSLIQMKGTPLAAKAIPAMTAAPRAARVAPATALILPAARVAPLTTAPFPAVRVIPRRRIATAGRYGGG